MILTIPLVTMKPVQKGVGERCMYLATEGELVEGMGHVWVHLEEWSNIEWFDRSGLCWVLKETVLEVGSSEGACMRSRLLLSVVVLSFCQWERKWGMMFLHP
jgi:hypothetical protein